MADYESVVCVKNEVFVYRIPARTSNRGYRAAEWKLDEPDWTGRLKVVSKGPSLTVRLEDKNSGELFAQCPVESYPTAAVEQVLDSSRYFVIRIQDVSGRAAFIGLGFADRGDSFDLLVALQDHFKQVKREEATKHEQATGVSQLDTGPKLDLGFKEGQTIKINIATKKTGEAAPVSTKPRPRGPAAIGVSPLLPPPPGAGTRVAAIPKPSPMSTFEGIASYSNNQPTSQTAPSSSSHTCDLLGDLNISTTSSAPSRNTCDDNLFGDDWNSGSFKSSSQSQTTKPQSVLDQNWVNFD